MRESGRCGEWIHCGCFDLSVVWVGERARACRAFFFFWFIFFSDYLCLCVCACGRGARVWRWRGWRVGERERGKRESGEGSPQRVRLGPSLTSACVMGTGACGGVSGCVCGCEWCRVKMVMALSCLWCVHRGGGWARPDEGKAGHFRFLFRFWSFQLGVACTEAHAPHSPPLSKAGALLTHAPDHAQWMSSSPWPVGPRRRPRAPSPSQHPSSSFWRLG